MILCGDMIGIVIVTDTIALAVQEISKQSG